MSQNVYDLEDYELQYFELQTYEKNSEKILKTQSSRKLKYYPNTHQKIFHDNTDKKCDICGNRLSGLKNLKCHINSIHNGLKEHKCDSCEISFYLAQGN